MNRHARLHTRKEEDGPTAKTGRKKKASSVSPSAGNNSIDIHPPPPQQQPPVAVAAPAQHARTPSLSTPTLSFNFPVPVAPPSFPAYSRPVTHDMTDFLNAAMLPQRRYSDVAYGTTLPSLHQPPMSRPRANTLAGLPEALGSFSLVASPESNAMDSSDDESDDGDDEEKDATYSPGGGGTTGTGANASSSKATKASEIEVESQYPSPAFTSYSPTDLQHDSTLADLEAILANDPLHSSLLNPSQYHQPAQNHHDDSFDYESFAASVEGPGPAATSPSTHMPTTLEDLLNAAVPPSERYPTPPSATVASAPQMTALPHHQPQLHLDFSSFTSAFSNADQQRRDQARADSNAFNRSMSSISMPSFTIPATAHAGSPTIAPSSLNTQALPLASASSAASRAAGAAPTASYPSAALAYAYASSFPSLLALPNGLGLSAPPSQSSIPAPSSSKPDSSQLLFDAYTKRSAPAFYIPSTTSLTGATPASDKTLSPNLTPASRLNLPIPTWSRGAFDGAEAREPASFLV